MKLPSSKFILPLLLFACLSLSRAFPVQAGYLQPPAQAFVKTEIHAPSGEEEEPDVRIWRIQAQSGQQGQTRIISYSRGDAEEAFCRIELSKTGEVISAELPGAGGNILQAEGFLAVPGYPAPCDILPQELVSPDAGEEQTSFAVRRTIGGELFVDKICVSSRRISAAAARGKGWLKCRDGDKPASLRLVKAVHCRSRQLICLQLWNPGGGWWLYEETPHRRSWRMEEPGR